VSLFLLTLRTISTKQCVWSIFLIVNWFASL